MCTTAKQAPPHHGVPHIAELHEQLGIRDEALGVRVGLRPHPLPLDAIERTHKRRNAAKRNWMIKEERKKLNGEVKLG